MPPEREISDDSVRKAARVEEGAEERLRHPVHAPTHRAPRSGGKIPQAGKPRVGSHGCLLRWMRG